MRILSAEEMQITGGRNNEGCGKLTPFIIAGCGAYGSIVGYFQGGWAQAWVTGRRYARACRKFCGS